jgi:hypothetical protein
MNMGADDVSGVLKVESRAKSATERATSSELAYVTNASVSMGKVVLS